MRRTILWVAAVAALIAIPAVIGLVALRGDDSSSSARRAGALVVPGNSATAYQLQLTQALAGNTEIKEAIEVESFSWNPENPTTIGSTTGGAGSGKIRFNEMQVGKKVDKASPVLFKQMAKGAHYKTAILTCRKAGDKEPYMTITMETAFISKIDYGAGSPEVRTRKSRSSSGRSPSTTPKEAPTERWARPYRRAGTRFRTSQCRKFLFVAPRALAARGASGDQAREKRAASSEPAVASPAL